MTTAVKPPAAENDLRILPISTNLLPEEISERRRVRTIKRAVLSAVAGFMVLLAAWYGVAQVQTATARDDLATAEADIQRLTQQQRTYDDLVKTQDESKRIKAQLKDALARDLTYSAMLTSIRTVAPAGVVVTNIAGALTPVAGNAAPAPASPTQTIGTMTVTGVGQSKAQVAAYSDALATVRGVANPLLAAVAQDVNGFRFTIQVEITGSALGGRFTKKAGE